MIDADPCIQAIVEVLKKSVELTRPQVAMLLGLMDVSMDRQEKAVAEGISRGLFATAGHSIRLARPHAHGALLPQDVRAAA